MTPEQSALLSKAYDSVRAAKLLSDAELYDFAVSRAYYAMFYMAEAFLLGVGLSFSRHAGVIAAFGERFAKTGIVPVEFHRYLNRLGIPILRRPSRLHGVREKCMGDRA
jgi:uncharacterized protein (UPF0332 family)